MMNVWLWLSGNNKSFNSVKIVSIGTFIVGVEKKIFFCLFVWIKLVPLNKSPCYTIRFDFFFFDHYGQQKQTNMARIEYSLMCFFFVATIFLFFFPILIKNRRIVCIWKESSHSIRHTHRYAHNSTNYLVEFLVHY